MLFFRILRLHSLPLKPVGFRFQTPNRVTCYTLSPLWIEHDAEQAKARQPCDMTKERQTPQWFLPFSKASVGVARSSGLPLFPRLTLTQLLFVLRSPKPAGWDHPKFFLWLICHGDYFCKGHTCVAGGLGSGVQRQPHVYSVVLCVLSTMYSQVALAQANIVEETCNGEDMVVKYQVRRIIICSA